MNMPSRFCFCFVLGPHLNGAQGYSWIIEIPSTGWKASVHLLYYLFGPNIFKYLLTDTFYSESPFQFSVQKTDIVT